MHKLFEEVAPRYAERPGGYTRILKLGPRRSDATEMVFLELVCYGSSAGRSRLAVWRGARSVPAGRFGAGSVGEAGAPHPSRRGPRAWPRRRGLPRRRARRCEPPLTAPVRLCAARPPGFDFVSPGVRCVSALPAPVARLPRLAAAWRRGCSSSTTGRGSPAGRCSPGCGRCRASSRRRWRSCCARRVALTVAGRTDRGVHALGPGGLLPGAAGARCWGSTRCCRRDVAVLACEAAPDGFDARARRHVAAPTATGC